MAIFLKVNSFKQKLDHFKNEDYDPSQDRRYIIYQTPIITDVQEIITNDQDKVENYND